MFSEKIRKIINLFIIGEYFSFKDTFIMNPYDTFMIKIKEEDFHKLSRIDFLKTANEFYCDIKCKKGFFTFNLNKIR